MITVDESCRLCSNKTDPPTSDCSNDLTFSSQGTPLLRLVDFITSRAPSFMNPKMVLLLMAALTRRDRTVSPAGGGSG